MLQIAFNHIKYVTLLNVPKYAEKTSKNKDRKQISCIFYIYMIFIYLCLFCVYMCYEREEEFCVVHLMRPKELMPIYTDISRYIHTFFYTNGLCLFRSIFLEIQSFFLLNSLIW